jgi:hypothetical protein
MHSLRASQHESTRCLFRLRGIYLLSTLWLSTKAGPVLMAWFRTNRSGAAWLALFALACQLAFSFGHVHIGKYASGFSHVADQTTRAAADGSPSSPENSPGKLSFDFCVICANISVASTLILPVLAAVLAPRLFTRVLRWLPATRAPAALYHRPFGARGPPSA